MCNRMYKIYNEKDFNKITKGIKVAECMQLKSSVDPVPETINQLDELTVSDSLSCSFCNTVFEDQIQQRLHYKLDWHRYNLKQRLRGLKPISEDEFGILLDKDDVSSLSGIDSDPEYGDDTDEAVGTIENSDIENKNVSSNNARNKLIEKKMRIAELMMSDSSESDIADDTSGKKKTETQRAVASRHSKVFFENADKNIFSIYRCLLHNKKEIPEVDGEMVAQALASGNNTMWTIIMLGGGHFAAAIFKGGEAIAHKTFHSYTVRAKQGSSQSSRDNRSAGGHCRSAGASLRRYNEMSHQQHIQEILESWSTHILNSSLILYRAVGPQNRTILFSGKNPPLDRNDPRLRPLPFPTKRATFNEVKRVFDILSTIEVYGSAADFIDTFPVSPRQPIRKKIPKLDLLSQVPEMKESSIEPNNCNSIESKNCQSDMRTPESLINATSDRPRCHRSRIDRAKPRRSPNRPLPDIITRLAKSSSESEIDCIIESNNFLNFSLIEDDCKIEFNSSLVEFEDTGISNIKQRKMRKQKKRSNKSNVKATPVHKSIVNAKPDLWKACEFGDLELLSKTWKALLDDVEKFEAEKNENSSADGSATLTMKNVLEMMNEVNEDGNTMLHLAANGNHIQVLWELLEIGIDPAKRNKKFQTAYVITTNKKVRNTFRRFMAVHPNKFDYNKSQIPAPLTAEMEQEEMEKKQQQRKVKREREKMKKKEFEIKKKEAEEKQRFLNLSDREKRALEAERRIPHGSVIVSRCFQCGTNTTGVICFEYNSNRFCSMPCLKEHRLHNKFIL